MPTAESNHTPAHDGDGATDDVASDDAAAAAAAVERALVAVTSRATEIDGAVRTFVVQRPLVALAGAIAGGFLIGRLLSR